MVDAITNRSFPNYALNNPPNSEKVQFSPEQSNELKGNLTHLLTILDLIFSELQEKLKSTEKSAHKRLKNKIHEKIDECKNQYLSKSSVAFVQGMATLASSLIFLSNPTNHEHTIQAVNRIIEFVGKIPDNLSDADLSELNTKNQLLLRELEEFEQKMQRLSQLSSKQEQVSQAGIDMERRSLSAR